MDFYFYDCFSATSENYVWNMLPGNCFHFWRVFSLGNVFFNGEEIIFIRTSRVCLSSICNAVSHQHAHVFCCFQLFSRSICNGVLYSGTRKQEQHMHLHFETGSSRSCGYKYLISMKIFYRWCVLRARLRRLICPGNFSQRWPSTIWGGGGGGCVMSDLLLNWRNWLCYCVTCMRVLFAIESVRPMHPFSAHKECRPTRKMLGCQSSPVCAAVLVAMYRLLRLWLHAAPFFLQYKHHVMDRQVVLMK